MRDSGPVWRGGRRPWGRADAVALLAWTVAIAAFFRDVVGLRRALFYFDITEINYPYRAFLARELRAGRFSRWCPDLYCGLPLYSESQAGYLHPLKYLLYPWLPTWQALNLDTHPPSPDAPRARSAQETASAIAPSCTIERFCSFARYSLPFFTWM